jgi:malate permease and related proteins
MTQANNVFLITLAIISMGYLLKRFDYISENEGKTLSKILMHTTFPALILTSTINVHLEARLFMITSLCILLSSLCTLVAWMVFKKLPTAQRAIFTMAAGGINVGLFGFPLIEGIFGAKAMLYAIMFDLGNAIMTFGLVYPIGHYMSNKGSQKLEIKNILKKIFALPPVPAMFIGLAINVFKIPVPGIVMDGINVLSRANMALILLLLGIYMSFSIDKSQIKNILKSFSLKYTIGLVSVACLYFCLVPSLMRNVLICLSVLPMGMTILPFSDELNFDTPLAGTMVNISLLVSFALIWILVLGLGLS